MTDKEFVISTYPDARFNQYDDEYGRKNLSIEITNNGRYRVIGWCRETTEEMTWFYARQDIQVQMLNKLEQI